MKSRHGQPLHGAAGRASGPMVFGSGATPGAGYLPLSVDKDMPSVYPMNSSEREACGTADHACFLHPAAPFGRPLLNNRRAFTMIELLVVLMLLAILGSVAAARFTGVTETAVRAGVPQKVMAHLRYAQAMAMGDHGHVYYLMFQGGTYCMQKKSLAQGGTVTPLVLPGESSSVVTLDAGVTVPSMSLGFSCFGIPVSPSSEGVFSDLDALSGLTKTIPLIGCDRSIMVNNAGKISLANS